MQHEEEERPYQRIFAAIIDGLIILDPQTGLIVAANPAASAMHGYSHQEFIGLHHAAIIHPDSHHLLQEYNQAVELGGTFAAVCQHLRRDGTSFFAELRGTAFSYQQRPCLLSVIRDVSARVQAEQQLAQHMAVQVREQASQAILQERQRMAQNLHDAVNQSLFSASLIAEVLPRVWERNPEEGRQSLEDLRRLTRGAMAEMRSLLAELRPLVLTDSELRDLLRQLGDAFTGRTDIPVQVTVKGEGALPTDVQVAFYRICQEALANIAKHARASQVELALQYDNDAVTLKIRDNGQGFDFTHTPAGHYGQSMMRERAKAIGAQLSVASQPGAGAEIVICWAKQGEEGSL